jgi:hypothetical protein
MKILYLSCHSILEFDELKLLTELGHEVFSPGAFVEPANPGDASLRPGIPNLIYDPYIREQYDKIGAAHPGEDGKDHLTKEFVDLFDCVIVMHITRWISNNWEVIKHKRVIWRTIGQSISDRENEILPYRLQGLQIVRYSPMENNIPGFVGSDALIRFYKDENELCNWEGSNKRVITFGQHMKARGDACSFAFFEEVTRPFPRHLYGPGNEGIGEWTTGKVPYSQLIHELQMNRVYFYTGTHPASYTLNFMEAWMVGIPVVAIGSDHGNSKAFINHNLYEVPSFIKNGINGFCSDNIEELRSYIKELLNNDSLAKSISEEGRKEAIVHFGKANIKNQWKEFLEK